MTDHAGQDLYKALKNVQTLYEQVALLLQTADAYLTDKDHGFKRLFGSTALAEKSGSIHHPDSWLPHTAFSFYRPPLDTDRIAAFASVIMAPVNVEQYKVKFIEPLISAGWVRYPGPAAKENVYWWSRLILYTDTPHDGVAQHHWISEDGKPSQHGNVERLCFALPLMQVKNSAALVERVLDPLIKSL